MVDALYRQRVRGIDPTDPAHLTTKNYVDTTFLPQSARGIAGGVAPLDSGLLVPIANLPTGTTAGTIALGNDARFTDARTPTAHKTTHATGGSDALTAADIGAVATTGAETIAGVKTFSSSPIVPTPTTATQAATKAYADLMIPLTQRAAASGVATLDSGTKVPIAQIPTGSTSTTVSLGNHNHAFSTLTEVSLSSPAAQQLLGYNGSNWTNVRRIALPPVALTDAATIATDASLGNHFRVTLAGNRTLGAPTNPVDGQKAIWEVIQDATGSRTLTLTTGSNGAFAFGTDITTITLTTTASKRDFIGAVYNSTAQRWYVIAFVKGY